ncbi:MAG: hypothetical protein INH41_13085 [Myxococcaceae bacterium]|nr:hypothetical protein [Myxococcaceae bacterium]
MLGSSGVGTCSPTPEELARFEWTADVKTSPPSPTAGRRLSLTLESASRSKVPVAADVFLRARRADGTSLHQPGEARAPLRAR